MTGIRRISRAGLGLALVWLTAAVPAPGAARSPGPDVDPGSAIDAPAPEFELRDQNGISRSLAEARGKVVLLAFVDTQCTNVCPLTTESMVQALRLLGPAALRVQLVGINANPLATSIADVAAYTRAHEMQGRWWFLTGTAAQLARVWRAYGVYVGSMHGEVAHQPVLVLIGPRGRERKFYFTQMSYGSLEQQAEVLAAGMAHLLPGHVVVHPPASLRYAPPLGPEASARLASFGQAHGRTVLGPAQPHLLLFFATWLDGATLPAKLAVLDGYAVLARRRGWPGPVAIDELPTEAPDGAWRRRMSRLAGALHTPVAVDSHGRLADGYGVHDLPWLTLTVSGRILWQHDGWLPLPQLAADVRAARPRGTLASAPPPLGPAASR
jgi:cytochrome oxidase Cu insertion factor (SCO1/SenC/PrrC family)